MTERGILMTPANYAAILDNRKTQTRRILKNQPGPFVHIDHDEKRGWHYWWDACHGPGDPDVWQEYAPLKCPFGTVGDRLYVKEAFTYWECNEEWKPKKGERFENLSPKQQSQIIEQSSHLGEDSLVYTVDGMKRSLGEWPFPHPVYDHCIGKFGKTVSPLFMPKWAARLWLELTDVSVERIQDISLADVGHEGYAISVDGGSPSDFAKPWNTINGEGSWERNEWVWVLSFVKVKP